MLLPFSLTFFGLALIYLEFFLPGVISLILGIFCMILGVVSFWMLPEIFSGDKAIYLIFNILAVVGVCKLALWSMRHKGKNQFFLEADQAGFTAIDLDKSLVGEVGWTDCDLKPSGYVMVKEKRCPALSEGKYILQGKKVLILEGRLGYFIVKEILESVR